MSGLTNNTLLTYPMFKHCTHDDRRDISHLIDNSKGFMDAKWLGIGNVTAKWDPDTELLVPVSRTAILMSLARPQRSTEQVSVVVRVVQKD